MNEANTFSIIARCPATRQLGVAVASAVPAVGSMCPYIRSDVGAASTQSWLNPYLALATLSELEKAPARPKLCARRSRRTMRANTARSAWSTPRAKARHTPALTARHGAGRSWTPVLQSSAICSPARRCWTRWPRRSR